MEQQQLLQFQKHCRKCRRIFRICKKHFRGQVYCSLDCRVKQRRERQRIYQKNYRKSEVGRLNHADQEKRRRQRKFQKNINLKKTVDEHTSQPAFKKSSALPIQKEVILFPRKNRVNQKEGTNGELSRYLYSLHCIVCGREGYLIDNKKS